MKLSNFREYYNLSFTLRCIAERFHEDTIANRCSDLAYRMEWMKQPITLAGIDATLATFALKVRENPEHAHMFKPRGKIYDRWSKENQVEADKPVKQVSLVEV